MPTSIVIDGYNLIKNSKVLDCSWEKMAQAREGLIRASAAYTRNRSHRIILVFDGGKSGWPTEERDLIDGVQVIFSRQGESADQVIMRLCDDGVNRSMVVVSADREIISHALNRQLPTISPSAFEKKLYRTCQPPNEYDKDEYEPLALTGTKKKGPSKRLPKKERQKLNKINRL